MHLKKLAALPAFALSAVLALGFLAQARAADKGSDAAGTWTWTMKGRQGGPDRKMTLKLKVDGDKVTGKLNSPGRDGQDRETEIKDGKLKGDEISFTVTREMNGNSITSKYNGKVSADSIKGKIEFERNGEPVSRDWEAKRPSESKDTKDSKETK
jgi:hypothetical protein